MIRIAVGYVAIVVICAVVITLNPMDFMGREAREARLKGAAQSGQVDVASVPAAGATEAETAPSKAAPVTTASADAVQETTAAILADLTAATAAATGDSALASPEAAGDEALAKMSAAVIEGLTGGSKPESDASLEGLVTQALIDGKTDEAIDQLVNEAVAEGTVEAPAGLKTTEGRVDTAVLLAAIVAEAQGGSADEFGQGDLSEPTELVEGGTAGMLAATEDVLYIVEAGDSLGSLALKFYGDSELYGEIFKANRQVLDTPESLRSGMKLLIPAKSSL